MITNVAEVGTAEPQIPPVRCEDVAACVEHQEKLETLVPRCIYAAFIGFPLIAGALSNGGIGFGTLLNAGIGFLAAKLVIWLVRTIILYPLHTARYDRAAAKLKARLQTEGISAGPFSWTIGAPGALAFTQAGEVLLVDRCSDYDTLRIPSEQIADVQVKRTSQVVTDTHHSGRTTLGGVGGSFGMAYTMGGRSSSISRTIENYVLELRVQQQRNGPVRTIVVPGGNDHRIVEELCAMVRRLEPAHERIEA